MEKFIRMPGEEVFVGVRVGRDTTLSYENQWVRQRLEQLKLVTESRICGDGFESRQTTVIDLRDGDILIFEDGKRGYIKPVERVCTLQEGVVALSDLLALGVRP
jgi:hypothetical protein